LASGRTSRNRYRLFRQLDGSHPFKDQIPGGFVDYPARRVPGTEVVYFNFSLAREIGLIPKQHPTRLTATLREIVLQTFALQIVNEYDVEHDTIPDVEETVPGSYMATRYLQLQHPGRTGQGSGDGRSVWNGCVSHRGIVRDFSSCGTGVTRLCPATAETGEFFKTGNWQADYGCGTATLHEGFESLLMSEAFHRNDIPTERILAILRRPDGFAINVRVGRNLIRPSHFFVHHKQNNLSSLRGVADLFMERQILNGDWPTIPKGRDRYQELAKSMARTFGTMAAQFEREYIFCWLDWDGDNILADGGIIDYGSVRQFGLFHREYRFDDGPRWSTTLPEQRRKAREIVQVFAQIRDYLITGEKRPLHHYRKDPVLTLFDKTFQQTRDRLLLHQVGFDSDARKLIQNHHRGLIEKFDRAHRHFERSKTVRGPRKLPDGITWNAVFSMRDMLRELPEQLLRNGGPISAEELVNLAASSYSERADRTITRHRRHMARELQESYLAMIKAVTRHHTCSAPELLVEIGARSATINAFARTTGDAVTHAAGSLVKQGRKLSPETLHSVVDNFTACQARLPEKAAGTKATRIREAGARKLFDELMTTVESLAYGH
jgi:hypothetical protein